MIFYEKLLTSLKIIVKRDCEIDLSAILKDKKVASRTILIPFIVMPGKVILKKIEIVALGKYLTGGV